MMTEEEKKEWLSKYYVKRDFTDEELDEYDYLCSIGINTMTDENKEFIYRLYRMIESIIHNDKLDYISKLHKIDLLIRPNMSLKNFYTRSFHFPSNINEDNISQKVCQ